MIERHIDVPAQAEQLQPLRQLLQAFWAAAALPAALAAEFELALEELFINVVMHARQPGTVPRVQLWLQLDDGAVTMTLEDDGPAFDPLALPAPDVEAGLGERPIGGLGIFLVRQLMDGVSYQRVGSCNRLRLRKDIIPAGMCKP